MSTKHTFTHADGTVSKRTSANRVYPFAVECVRNEYGYAASIEKNELAQTQRRIAEFDAALAAGDIEVRVDDRSYGTVHTVYVGRAYAGSWITGYTYPQGNLRPDDEALDPQEAAATERARMVERAERAEAEIQALREGPEFSYGIHSWTSRRDLAQKEASRMEGRSWYLGYRVVETTYVTK